MKKILIDVDEKIFPRDSPTLKILDSLLEVDKFKQSVIAVLYHINSNSYYECKKVNGIKSYARQGAYLHDSNKKPFLKHFIRTVFIRCLKFFNFYKRKGSQFALYKNIYKSLKFDEILKITYRLNEMDDLINFKKNFGVPYSIIMLDPISVSPTVMDSTSKSSIISIENKMIKNSHIYFVPQGWLKEYKKVYKYTNIYEFFFPLIKKHNPSKKICTNTNSTTFLHLGNIYEDREHTLVADYFTKRNKKIDVFGVNYSHCHEKCFEIRNKVENVDVILNSYDFMILLDNVGRNINFIPSKLIDYINTGKPIIAFGKGDNNSYFLLKKYPLSFYCKSEKDFENLDFFISQKKDVSLDLQIIYKEFFKNLNEFVAKEIIDKINQ